MAWPRRSRKPKPARAEDRISVEPVQVWKAKHECKPVAEKIVAIKCLGGKIHRIHLRFPGHITLLNHPDLKGEKTMMKLGGDKPECLSFLERWHRDIYASRRENSGRPIVLAFLYAREEWQSKRAEVRKSYHDWILRPIKERLLERLDNIHKTLHERITNQWETKEEREYRQRWRGYNKINPNMENNFIRPIINLRFVPNEPQPAKESVDEKNE